MPARGPDPVDVVRRLGGVASTAQLRDCSRRAVHRAIESGLLVRNGRGHVALPVVDETLAAAVRLGGVASHLSAAMVWKWPVKAPPTRPEVTVPRHRHRSAAERAGVAVHWADLPSSAVHAGRVTTPVQTVIDCSRTLPFDEALCVADAALRSGRVLRADLLAAAQASPRTGRPSAVAVATAADDRAANPFESCLRAIARSVPGLQVGPQVQIGRIGRVDLADLRLRLVLEADSFAYHASPESFRHDLRRYTALVREGWRVVRFCWEDVMHHPDYVHAVLVDLVAQGRLELPAGYRPGVDSRLGRR